MKTNLLFSALAVGVLFAGPAGALSGGPAQFMPPHPYPSYRKSCLGSRYVAHRRYHVEHRRIRNHVGEDAPR